MIQLKKYKQKRLTNFFILPSKNHQELKKYFKIVDFAFGFHPDYDELYKYGLCPLKTYDYMFHKLPILFVGEKSYLDVKVLELSRVNLMIKMILI